MSPTCREVPTAEECQAIAQEITDECLRGCVELQCAGVEIKCDEYTREQCKKDREMGIHSLGFTWMNSSTKCKNPKHEINWCEESVSRECRARGMVHELAHSCGWDHGQGMGVPGDDGNMTCE